MIMKRIAALVLVAMGGFGAVACAGVEAAAPARHTITMENMQFSPATLTVKVGDTVTWVNKDVVSHTATSKEAALDSGRIDPDKSWKVVLKKAGAIDYICTYHPAMGGKIVVKGK